jgi:hypothetical protein
MGCQQPPVEPDVPWEELLWAFMATAEAEATAEGCFTGTPKTKAGAPVVRPTEGPTAGGGRKGVGSLKTGQKKQEEVKAAAGGERSAGQEYTFARVKAATGSQSVAGKECTPGKKAATGGLRAAGMECLPREKAATGGDSTVGKECPLEGEAATGGQRGAGKECASQEGNGGEEADLEGLYSVRGKEKIVGPELAQKYMLGKPIDDGKPGQSVRACVQRAQVLRREMPLALGNLLAAQHRDQRWEVRAREESGVPAAGAEICGGRLGLPGVYLCRQPVDSTDVSVSRGAYKVHQVGANGRLMLLGADKTVFKEHMENCAPCHNPNIETTVDPTLTTVPASHLCQVCRSAGDEGTMLLCDSCLEGWHMGSSEDSCPNSRDPNGHGRGAAV